MTNTNSTTVFSLAQAFENLRDVEDRLRGAFGYPAVTGPQVERIARIVASALVIIEERLDRADKAVDLLAKLIDRHGEQIEQLNLESCSRVSTARLEAERLPRPQLPLTLLELLADCRHCGAAFEIVEIGGCDSPVSRYVRCSDSTCVGHGEYWPITRTVGEAYNDRIMAEEASFGVQHEDR